MKRLIIGVTAALGLGLGSAQAQAVKADPSIAAYQKVSGVSGNINSVGSDTMNNLMTFWAEAFQKTYAASAASPEAWTEFRSAYLDGTEADYQAAVGLR